MKRKLSIFWQMLMTVLLLSIMAAGCGAGGSTPSDSKTEYVIRLALGTAAMLLAALVLGFVIGRK